MKLHVAFSILFIGFSGCALANPLYMNGVNANNAQPSKNKAVQNAESSSILSVFLYLPVVNNGAYSSTMAQSQLQVTPSTTITVNNLQVSATNSKNGTCTGSFHTFNIGLTTDPTFTLTGGQTYLSTDASNWALKELPAAGGFNYTNWDTVMQFRNGTTNVGTEVCIAGSNLNPDSSCTDAGNCGWNSVRTWTP